MKSPIIAVFSGDMSGMEVPPYKWTQIFFIFWSTQMCEMYLELVDFSRQKAGQGGLPLADAM